MIDVTLFILVLIAGATALALFQIRYRKYKKMVEDLLRDLLDSEEITGKYVRRLDHSSGIISDISYLYEFEFNGKKIYVKHYPKFEEGVPPYIPEYLVLNKEYLSTLNYFQLIINT